MLRLAMQHISTRFWREEDVKGTDNHIIKELTDRVLANNRALFALKDLVYITNVKNHNNGFINSSARRKLYDNIHEAFKNKGDTEDNIASKVIAYKNEIHALIGNRAN